LVDEAAGALLCRKCFSSRNGDGLAALQWLNGWTLPRAVDAVAEYIGDGTGPQSANRKRARPAAKPKTYPTLAAATAATARAVGTSPTATWPYHDAAGVEVATVVRFDLPDGDKTFRMVSRSGDGWAARGPDPPRPLYRLPELADAPRVFIVEGEKCADAGRSVGLVATCSMNGALAPQKADWQPLAGKDVVLCPDADEPGEEYISTVGGILAALRPAPRIKVLRLEGLEPGGDLWDWLELRDAHEPAELTETLHGLADDAPNWQPQSPAVAAKTVGPALPWQPFPTAALPEPMAGFVSAAARAVGCDEALVAVPLLAGLAAAVGNSRRVELKRGWQEPAIIWSAVVAESGTAKSPAMELALRPIRQWQKQAMAEHAEAVAAHSVDVLHYEKELAAWRKSKTGGEPPERPDEPTAARYWTDDCTLEALALLLLQNPRGLLCARDELAGWLGSFDKYSKGSGDAPKWLELWGGRSICIDRKTGNPKTIFVPRAAVSLCGCIQPAVLWRALGPEHFQDGLAARLLLASPPRRAKRWTEADIAPTCEWTMAELFRRLYELEPEPGPDGEPQPVTLRLDGQAKRQWVSFFDEHAEETAALSGELAAVWAKLEAYAARLALLVHLVRLVDGDSTAGPECIDADSVAAGVKLARWFGHEARRLYSQLSETEEDTARRQLAELIGRLGGRVTPRDIRHHGYGGDADKAEMALAELVTAGVGQWQDVPPGPGGGRPTRAFVLGA
jgi:hypothetical protein